MLVKALLKPLECRKGGKKNDVATSKLEIILFNGPVCILLSLASQYFIAK